MIESRITLSTRASFREGYLKVTFLNSIDPRKGKGTVTGGEQSKDCDWVSVRVSSVDGDSTSTSASDSAWVVSVVPSTCCALVVALVVVVGAVAAVAVVVSAAPSPFVGAPMPVSHCKVSPSGGSLFSNSSILWAAPNAPRIPVNPSPMP